MNVASVFSRVTTAAIATSLIAIIAAVEPEPKQVPAPSWFPTHPAPSVSADQEGYVGKDHPWVQYLIRVNTAR